jgi:ATP-dependent DNA helicase UvrD/PcrA
MRCALHRIRDTGRDLSTALLPPGTNRFLYGRADRRDSPAVLPRATDEQGVARMRFHADLHVHSKYSRATSRDLDLEHLAAWACRKGIGVVATGDFTHPAWCAELKQKLVPAEGGLYRLRDDIERAVLASLPASCRTPVRFLLEVEISTIYKKGERTRKVHHLIYAPDFATVDRMSARLARIGNIASDGRPILGLDSRDLLEIALESGPHAYLVPAHIWTPWFAALGSQSGFDSIADCYGDLADRIFAVETGLSSDPPMNWRVSFLDRYRLTSNSDAHSPGKLGREATTFDCELDYFAIEHALRTGHGYVGTVEFFPDEGKYHLDGHRKCEVRLSPKETLAHGGRCPVCGEALTIGVEHRVEMLADRGEGEARPPATAGAVANLVPLPEILSELAATGVASRAVTAGYDQAIAKLGAELTILQSVPVEDIARAGSPLLAEAITRLRAGQVIREPGYDGEYGVIRLFEESELKRLTAGGLLFDVPSARRKAAPAAKPNPPVEAAGEADASVAPARPRLRLVSDRPSSPPSGILAALDADQRAAAEILDGPLLIIAGPGSGKTRTLTYRLAHLVAERGAAAQNCLAITFTRRAAAEMRERLARLLPAGTPQVEVHTFHSLGLALLREHAGAAGLARGFRVAGRTECVKLLAETLALSEPKAERLVRAISKEKRTQSWAGADAGEAMAAYARALALRNWIDFDDLVALSVRALTADAGIAERCRDRFRWISVDEFQDVDEQQYRLLTLLAPPDSNLCVIGDPDQAIYGFRGADASCFDRFRHDYPSAHVVRLARNYRSTGTIVTASAQVIAARRSEPIAEMVRDMHERIAVHAAPTERAEAEFVVKTIEQMIGGHSFFSIDSGRATPARASNRAFADFAVLYRTDAQSAALCEAFERSGIPYQKSSHAPLADAPAVRALLHELGEPGAAALPDALRAAGQRLLERGTTAEGAAVAAALQRLTALAQQCGNDPARLLDAAALTTDAEFRDARAARVSLLTLHAAKGLEFAVVFITGLEDGLLPLYWNERDDAVMAEERRLFYVGMTRAKDRLILSRARQRHWRGRVQTLEPSPFLRDIEHELMKQQPSDGGRRKPPDRQLKLL